jgi:nucleoside 2-deoxyribosyltransferase
MSARPSVYLAGPIKGCSYAGATSWREYVKILLEDVGIDAFSPLRAKQYLRGLDEVGNDLLKDSYAQFPLSTNKAILHRDRHDCMKCDAVLMNLLGATNISIGTVMEVAWADAARVPVILVMEKDGSNPHEHGLMVEACGFRVDNLDEGIRMVGSILLP